MTPIIMVQKISVLKARPHLVLFSLNTNRDQGIMVSQGVHPESSSEHSFSGRIVHHAGNWAAEGIRAALGRSSALSPEERRLRGNLLTLKQEPGRDWQLCPGNK